MMGDLDWTKFLENEAQIRHIVIGEHRLRVIEMGAGEPVLLVHGFADSAYTWHRNFRPLAAAGFRVLAYDHPGCGESALPSGFCFGVDDLTRLVVALLDELGVERTHLVGHSMGGGVGLQLAIHHSDRLCRVALVAPVCYHVPFRPLVYFFRCLPFVTLARHLSRAWLIRPFLRFLYGDPALLTQQVLAQYLWAFRRPEYLHACAGLLRGYWNRTFYTTARRYQEISLPLHLIWGERDIWMSLHHYAFRLAAETGANLSVIAGAGHVVQQARPEPFNEIVTRFLRAEQ